MRGLLLLEHILLTIILLIPVIMLSHEYVDVFASPSFSKQELIDSRRDWVNLTTDIPSSEGDGSTDILAVHYVSDGKTLNATLWLLFPFKDEPSEYDTVNYGMFIDVDFSNKTGVNGIDYQIEIKWRNETKTWDKVVTEWSSTGSQRTLNKIYNYTGFFEKEHEYVALSLDLGSIGYPNIYKGIFYAEEKKGNDYLTDFTDFVAIPAPEIEISTLPPSLVVRQGETKTIELKLNSTYGYEPIVNIYAKSQSNDIKFDFKENDTLRIPSYGTAVIPMTVSVSEDAPTQQHTIFIFADSTLYSTFFANRSQETISQSSLTLTIKPPMSLLQRLGLESSEESVRISIPQEYLIGLYGIVLSFLIPSIARWYGGRRQAVHMSKYMTRINHIYDSFYQNTDLLKKSLQKVKREIADSFAKGTISESNYKILNEKISEYENNIDKKN